MTLHELKCGFIPLVDAAPLVVAREMGFAEDEGLDLVLLREPSWSALRDKLALGWVAAAHMLAPAAVAMSMGIGGIAMKLDVLSILSVNGEIVGVSRELARKMRAGGPPLDIVDAADVGRKLLMALDRPLRIGAPFPFSMHLELIDYWLTAIGVPEEMRQVRILPPPLMAETMAAGELDLFCVGEPWGSEAVEAGVAEIALVGGAIWGFAPEKALAVRADWAEAEPETVRRLMRAVWRATRWLGDADNLMTAAEFLARDSYVGVSTDVVERALTGRLIVTPEGDQAAVPRFMEFFDGAATFPWRSQAIWIAERLARRHGVDVEAARAAARATFRPDLYRRNLGPIGADLPGASEKVEGSLAVRTPVATSRGMTFLGPDRFFDGAVFDFSA